MQTEPLSRLMLEPPMRPVVPDRGCDKMGPRMSAPGRLRLSHRGLIVLATILFVLPTALFAMSLETRPAVLVLVGCLGIVALVATGASQGDDFGDRDVDLRRLLLAIAVAAGLLLLGGETHTFFATPDWQIRDAVLADLSRFGFPVSYHVDGADYLLRAPLGMYMAPAAVGHVLGLTAAHAALLAQNALLLGTIFYVLAALGRGWPHLTLLILYGGLSVIGALVRISFQPWVVAEFWRWSLDAWHPQFQFSSSMVQFFWVPNHALAGWWLATLFLLQRRSAVDIAVLGASVAPLAFWSPLAVVPAVPWLAWLAVTRWREVFPSRRIWVGALLSACFIPVAFYMVAASGSIAHGASTEQRDFGFWYAAFMLVELPAAMFLLCCWRRIPSDLRALVVMSVAVLLVLPFFRFGPNNDLVMRGSTTPLVIVAFAFGLVLLDLTRARARAALIGWALALAATPTAALEVVRAVTKPAYRISDCSLYQASQAVPRPAFPTNYLADISAMPQGLVDRRQAAEAPVASKPCWPDLPQ